MFGQTNDPISMQTDDVNSVDATVASMPSNVEMEANRPPSTPLGNVISPGPMPGQSSSVVNPSPTIPSTVPNGGPVNDPKPIDISELNSIKDQALDQLYPMFDHLDLSPSERFRTIMMIIQATDNRDMIKSAYEAANKITDEKEKAQALLDIVNEINYFSQQSE